MDAGNHQRLANFDQAVPSARSRALMHAVYTVHTVKCLASMHASAACKPCSARWCKATSAVLASTSICACPDLHPFHVLSDVARLACHLSFMPPSLGLHPQQVLYDNKARLLCAAEGSPAELFARVVTVADAPKRTSSRSSKFDDADVAVDNELGFAKDRTISRWVVVLLDGVM